MMGFDLVLSLLLRLAPKILPYVGMAALAGWIFLQGQHSAERKAELASARATIVVLEETSRRNALAAEMATQAANRRAVNERDLQDKVEAYETELKTRNQNQGPSGCLLDDVDIKRLREFD